MLGVPFLVWGFQIALVALAALLLANTPSILAAAFPPLQRCTAVALTLNLGALAVAHVSRWTRPTPGPIHVRDLTFNHSYSYAAHNTLVLVASAASVGCAAAAVLDWLLGPESGAHTWQLLASTPASPLSPPLLPVLNPTSARSGSDEASPGVVAVAAHSVHRTHIGLRPSSH